MRTTRTFGSILGGAGAVALLLLSGIAVSVPAVAAPPAEVATALPALRPAVAGIPDAPTVIYQEDFQNAPLTGATRIADYVSTTGVSYTASPIYLNTAACNGAVFGRAATNAALGAIGFCAASWWPSARAIPYGMGQFRGMATPNDNLAVAEQTGGGGGGPYTGVMLEGTGIPTGVTAGGGRYVTFSLDVGNLCANNAQALDRFYLLDGPTAILLNTTDYNVCADPSRQTFAVDGRTVSVATFTGNQAYFVTSPTIGFRLTNQQGSGSGNDQAFDNFRILDATPQLDKSFAAMNPATGESRVTFTVTNTTDLGTKLGWSAAEELPAGLVISDSPDSSTTCVNGTITAAAGTDTVSFGGDLAGTVAQRTSCVFAVDVVPATATAQGDAPQVFQNCAANFTTVVGLDLPAECATVSFPSVAQLTVSKATSATADTVEGDEITYTVTATNTGGADYTAGVPATITDDLTGVLDDATYNGDAAASLPGTVSYTAPELSWSGALAAGASVIVTYTMTATLAGDGSLANVACIQLEQASGDECATVTTEVAIAPSIGLIKSVSPSAPADFVLDQEVEYTFVATNTGNLALDGPTVTEVSFDGENPMSAIDCPPTAALAPGEQLVCTATYTITQADIDNHSLADPLINEAIAEATASNGADVESPVASAQLPAIQSPAITIVKSAQAAIFATAGQTVTYEFLVTNTGNVTLTGADVTEGEFSGTGELSPVVCPAGAASMAPGVQVTCTATYELTQADVDAGTVSNSASGTAVPPTGDPIVTPPSEFDIDIEQTPSIGLLKSAGPGGFTHAGEIVEYEFEVTNTGNVTLDAVAIDETAFSGTGELGAPVCDVTELAPTEVATCTVDYPLTQADVDAGLVDNSAIATGAPPVGDDVESAVSSALVTVTPSASIGLEKTVDHDVVAGAGATVTYEFLVTNTGQATVADIAIAEGAFSGTGELSEIDCPVTAIAPGASLTCTATYVTTAADLTAGSVTNTATASAVSSRGGGVVSAPSTAEVTVNPIAAGLAQTGATLTWVAGMWGVGLIAVGAVFAVTRIRSRAT